MSDRNEILSAVLSEMKHWSGVTYDLGKQNKHYKIRLRYDGQNRILTMPVSASDHRAGKNQVTYLKRALRDMGAARGGA